MCKKLITEVIFVLTTILISTCFINAQGQNQNKSQVMIVGVYHFANPNADYVKSDFPDHLSEKKQKEIADVLDLLAKFKPTKIVLESVPENTKVLNHYQEYLKDNYKLMANESDQIGFRLAKQLGHKQVYLVDHRLDMDFDALMAAANETKNTQFLNFFQHVIGEAQAMMKRQAEGTVREALIELNEPLLQERTKEFYMQMARVRNKEKFVGADVLTSWYQRNFRIFTNLTGIIDSPNDRILVVFGQGHIPYLRDAVKSSPDMQLIEPNDYLKVK